MYTPPIRQGKAPIKKASPVPTFNALRDVGSIAKLVNELTLFKFDLVQELQAIQDVKESILKIQKGEPGKDADEERIANFIMRKIRVPKDGADADQAAIVSEVLAKLPKIEPVSEKRIRSMIKEQMPQQSASLKVVQQEIDPFTVIEAILNLSHDRFQLTTKHITGLEQTLEALKSQVKTGMGYVHGGGDTIAQGSGISVTNGTGINAGKKVISATGSGAFNILTATGTVDDINTIFNFVSAPSVVVINGAFYRLGSTVGGTQVWTIVGTTVTLAFPVGTGGDIYGIA